MRRKVLAWTLFLGSLLLLNLAAIPYSRAADAALNRHEPPIQTWATGFCSAVAAGITANKTKQTPSGRSAQEPLSVVCVFLFPAISPRS